MHTKLLLFHLLLWAPLIARAAPDPANLEWSGYGNDTQEQHYSPAKRIDTHNVDQLKLAWFYDLPREGALEGIPLEVAGVVYFTGSMGTVYAVNAITGESLWTYDPSAGQRMDFYQRMIYPVNRGLAYDSGKVFVATRDGRMIALDCKTGRAVWTTQFLTKGDRATSTGAPRVAKNLVIIGNSGAEANARGYITALDAASGKVKWRFYTVPGDPSRPFEDPALAMAAKTWSGEWWKLGGGGTPWNSIVYDAQFNQILIGTGNGSPYAGRLRGTTDGKANLFLTSVVAVDAETGRYKWHYQYNPGEVWDYKACMDIILVDLDIKGKPKKVLLHAPTNGFFYVIDRATGNLLSAEKTGKVTWASRIDMKTGLPVENPEARYEKGTFVLYPGVLGSHDWQAMAYSPQTQLAYLPYQQLGSKFWHDKAEEDILATRAPGFWNVGVIFEPYKDAADPLDGRGSLIAWDPKTQKIRWRQDHPNYWNGGVLTTGGGLVFQGQGNGQFVAYDAADGRQLWSFDAQVGIIGAPISYTVDSRQYVSVLAGYGGGGADGSTNDEPAPSSYRAPRRLLTFTFDGRASLPPATIPAGPRRVDILDNPQLQLDETKVARGAYLWNYSCIGCHGAEARSMGGAPDLRASTLTLDPTTFDVTLTKNVLVKYGMPRFDDLSRDDVDALYQYIRSVARKSKFAGVSH